MTDADVVAEVSSANPYQAMSDEVSGVLGSLEEVSDYLERVVHAVRRHVEGCDEVGITLTAAEHPQTAAYTTVTTLEIDAVQYALDEGPCLDAARHRRENKVTIGEADERWPRFAEAVRRDGMRSLYAFPLVSGEQCIGALNLYAWAQNAFDDLDLAVVRMAASRAADVVVAGFELDGAKRLAGQLEQAMASRAVIEQAKGVLMAMHGVSEQDAFQLLRRRSQDRNIKVRALAEQIVAGVARADA